MKLLVAFAVLVPVVAAGDDCIPFDPETSHVEFEIEQAGSPFRGHFETVRGEVCRDGASIRRVQASVSADSLETGLPELDAVLRDELFLDVARYPEMQFISNRIVQEGDQWIADGELTIKGKTRAVRLPFKVNEIPGASQASGEIEIRRLDFAVGTGEWANTEWLSNAVRVRFHVQENMRQD